MDGIIYLYMNNMPSFNVSNFLKKQLLGYVILGCSLNQKVS